MKLLSKKKTRNKSVLKELSFLEHRLKRLRKEVKKIKWQE